MMMHHHTKFGYKRLSSSEDICTKPGQTDRYTDRYSESNTFPLTLLQVGVGMGRHHNKEPKSKSGTSSGKPVVQMNTLSFGSIQLPKYYCTITQPSHKESNNSFFRRLASYLTIQFAVEDGPRVTVVADLGPFLEVAHLELARMLLVDDGHQTAGKQSLHNVCIFHV